MGDKAYSSKAIRAHLRSRKITAVIPEPDNQINNRLRRGSAGGRPPSFDPTAYRGRHVEAPQVLRRSYTGCGSRVRAA